MNAKKSAGEHHGGGTGEEHRQAAEIQCFSAILGPVSQITGPCIVDLQDGCSKTGNVTVNML